MLLAAISPCFRRPRGILRAASGLKVGSIDFRLGAPDGTAETTLALFGRDSRANMPLPLNARG